MLAVRTLASGSGGNCHLLIDSGSGGRLLLDCGVPFKRLQAFAGYDVAGLAACLVSHGHRDHDLAADGLLRRGVLLCGPPGVAAMHPGAVALNPMAAYRVGPFAVTAFAVDHDAPCYGYVVDRGGERLVYITDAHDISVRLPCVTVLMIEANHDPELLRAGVRAGRVPPAVARRVAAAHMPIATTARLVAETAALSPNLRDVWLVHMSMSNADGERFRARVQGATGAAVRIAGE